MGKMLIMLSAKFYKSADSGTSQVLLNQRKQNRRENLKSLAFPQKVIRVINSYTSEAKEDQFRQSKVLFKYAPKDKRLDVQKALTPVREIVNSLVTSYTFPLRRIHQSVCKENLAIKTSLGNKRVVLRENLSNPLTGASSSSGSPLGGPSSSKRSKNNKRGLAKENQKLNISLESGILKA